MHSPGVGGIAATSKYVVVSDRENGDTHDAFLCLDAETGNEIWKLSYPAQGDLDYGSSPRATPLIDGERVYLCGAFGHLNCVELSTGDVLWTRNLRQDFHVTNKLVWGHASSPLVVDNKLIVNPGGPDASVIALELETGDVIWQTAGEASAFSSFVTAQVGGQQQIIGYDAKSISGWRPEDGKRLWTHTPQYPNDFNVPTPLIHGDNLVLTTENNGTRLFAFTDHQTLNEKLSAVNEDLAPDTHTPVIVRDRLFGVWNELYCLDLKNGLKPLWTGDSTTFNNYTSIIASDDKILITGIHGEVLLIDALADSFKVLSSIELIEEDSGVYSHPAMVGDRFYIRGSSDIRCFVFK